MNINVNLTKDEKCALEMVYHFGKMFLIGAGEGALLATPFVRRGKTMKSKILRLAIAEVAFLPLNAAISYKETQDLVNRLNTYEDNEKKDENVEE